MTNHFILSYTGLFLWGRKEHGHNYPMKELPLMYLLNNASVYCQQTQHSLLVRGLLSVLRCNWRRKVGVPLLGDNSESNTSGLCIALHTLYHLVWSYLLGQKKRLAFETLHKKATKNQLSSMVATSKNVLSPGHNHLLTTGADDPSLKLLPEHQWGWQLKWRIISTGG